MNVSLRPQDDLGELAVSPGWGPNASHNVNSDRELNLDKGHWRLSGPFRSIEKIK